MLKSYFFLPATLVAFFTLIATSPANAQEIKPDTASAANVWDFSGIGNVNFSQISLSNWAAGGQNSLSVLSTLNLVANYKKGRNTWNNSANVTFGFVKLQGQRLQKSDDRLELNFKYGREASDKWFYTGQVNIRTQLTPTFTPARDTVVSNFLSPAFSLVSLGMDYKPSPRLSIFVSTLTGKFTVVMSQRLADLGYFGVKPAWRNEAGKLLPGTGERFRSEVGGFLNVRFSDKVWENVSVRSRLDLFSNYLRNPQNVDVNWENLVDFKVNKFISASLFCHLVYDDDIMINVDRTGDGKIDGKGPRLQFKETLGIGFSYKFD
ncbi:DUF3078 domain-containing protein [Pontibacter beigongshangensis]|uniref:DUF3078 domain-containing protein n=1 Tax=Pontibacter beigongshangensis TaxID=2574733 RepID=UPI00164FB557|nr:DUF3078 domain-containing protein [Pontibacter beigongshangensis]